MRRGFVRHMLPLRSFWRRVFIRHLRMLRGTLLSGRSSSGTCARFEAHSSAAGLHPAPAHASGHTPQRQVFIRHLRLLRGTLLSGPLLPRVARRGLAAAAEYLSEREADAVAEAGDGRGVSRHPACGIARVRPKNAGTMPLRQNGREASGNECGRGLCVLLQSRGFPPERMSRRETGWEVPPNAVAAGCLVRVSKQPIVMRLNGIRPATPRSASLAAALFCAFIPHPPPFPPRSIPTTSRGQLFRTDFSYPPRSTPPGMCGSTERRRRPVRDAIPPASPSTPQSDGKGRPHRAGMINRPRVREALHTQTDEPAPGKGGSK